MKVHQWEVWKSKPPGFETDHWFIVISGQERCDHPSRFFVNGLACFTLRGQLGRTDVQADAADGFTGPTAIQCDYIYPLEKRTLHSSRGMVSWERQQAIKAKVREVLRF